METRCCVTSHFCRHRFKSSNTYLHVLPVLCGSPCRQAVELNSISVHAPCNGPTLHPLWWLGQTFGYRKMVESCKRSKLYIWLQSSSVSMYISPVFANKPSKQGGESPSLASLCPKFSCNQCDFYRNVILPAPCYCALTGNNYYK